MELYVFLSEHVSLVLSLITLEELARRPCANDSLGATTMPGLIYSINANVHAGVSTRLFGGTPSRGALEFPPR
jgi:hypothetical protein